MNTSIAVSSRKTMLSGNIRVSVSIILSFFFFIIIETTLLLYCFSIYFFFSFYLLSFLSSFFISLFPPFLHSFFLFLPFTFLSSFLLTLVPRWKTTSTNFVALRACHSLFFRPSFGFSEFFVPFQSNIPISIAQQQKGKKRYRPEYSTHSLLCQSLSRSISPF